MPEVIPFAFHGTQVRVIEQQSEPWFVLADLCKVLDIARRPSALAERLDEDVRQTYTLPTAGGPQAMILVSEPGMWDVVLRSDKPEAKPLRRWITGEVLPSIRKTGSYSLAEDPTRDHHRQLASISESRMQMELCQAAKGLIDPDHLEAKARVVLSRGLGEHAVLDPKRRPLYTTDFLAEKNLSRDRVKRVAGPFGKKVKAAYTQLHGEAPGKYPMNMTNGQVRDVLAYTEADRNLLEQVWQEHYVERTLDLPL